jgi:hypothetical protein
MGLEAWKWLLSDQLEQSERGGIKFGMKEFTLRAFSMLSVFLLAVFACPNAGAQHSFVQHDCLPDLGDIADNQDKSLVNLWGNAYGLTGPFWGVVDIFGTDGRFDRQIVTRGKLNSPWGLAFTPSHSGKFSNDLMIGNFGRGRINAFDPLTGKFRGIFKDPNRDPIIIHGLFGLKFDNGFIAGSQGTVFSTVDINHKSHGPFDSVTVIPEPPAFAMMLGALGLLMAIQRLRGRRGRG